MHKNTTFVILALLLALAVGCSKKESQPTQAPQSSSSSAPAPAPSAAPAAPAATQPTQAPPAAPAEKSSQATNAANIAKLAPAPAPVKVTIPSGTTITVRLDNQLSSKTSEEEAPFTGTVARPVVVGEKAAIPKDAVAKGLVVTAKPAGKLAGAAQLSLRLTSVSFRGQIFPLRSSLVSYTGKGKGKRTAVMGGGGAGVGAIVGGLASGGKGAVVGGLVGGGAGTAGSAFTGNADITLPAESTVSFRLAAPLTIGSEAATQ